MIVIDDLHPVSTALCVVTIGFFDGVHEGHRSLIRQVREEAAKSGLCSAVITFAQHPRQVLHSDFIPELLTTLPEKIQLLDETGLDYCFLLSFTPELAALSACQFMQQVVKERCNAHTLLVGYDHRFGYGRSEGFEEYRRYGLEIGVCVKQAEALCHARQAVSSSLIRRLLQQQGDVKAAREALGYFYSVTGRVVHGHQLGRRLGFPTANVETTSEKLLPADGVYAVSVKLEGEDSPRPGVLNIGCRPTVDNGTNRTIEVHLPHFERDLYGMTLRLSFLSRLRSQQRFDSLEALSARIAQDSEQALKVFFSCFG